MATAPAWTEQFVPYAQRLLDLYQCPGLALGMAEHGELIGFNGFGCRDVDLGLPMTLDTIMGTGSVTKSFTCVAVMQLQEAGRLSVHDPVVKYLPEFRTPNPDWTRAITLHHLMTHTAGLPPLPTLLGAMVRSMRADPALKAGGALDQIQPITTPVEMLDLIAATPFELLGPPGTRFSYSNDGFALLGEIVARVSGVPFTRHVKEKILLPAGMTRSTLDSADLTDLTDVAALYISRPKEGGESEVVPAPGWWEVAPMEAAGHLRSTIRDMLRYCEIYRTGGAAGGARILREESVRAMTTPYVECHDGSFYGYGLMITPSYHGLSLIEHGGSIKGVSAHFTVVPGRDLTGAVLNNMAGVPAGDILLAAVNGAVGLPVETKRIPIHPYAWTVGELALFAGEYPTTEGIPGKLVFWVEGGQLWVKSEGGLDPMPPAPLAPVGPGRFVHKVKESTVRIRFHFAATGRVWAASIGLRMLRKAPAAGS